FFTVFSCLAVTATVAQNPYLPLWEHVPDGEPRVFEDPDNLGKLRAYIIGSHDVRFRDYCGPDIRMWSAPVENLNDWRDEGPIFTYNIDNQWDVMFAPDLVEVQRTGGKKEYYLFPHCRGNGRLALVAKSDRPNGPFKVVNATEDGRRAVQGSILGFDPSIFVEKVTDKNDPDYKIGFRAYGFWGFQQSSAAQLDQNTMYSQRAGTELIPYFIPASARYGQVKDPEGTKYPALYKEQNPGDFNFFEASSIRQVGNKYVMVFSGYSGPDYGLGSTNSALRYAFGDSPLGPWRSGGVLVDSRGVVVGEDGAKLITTNFAHNTHGSLQQINGQWYVFYHRPPRGFGNARQSAVAPVTIQWDEKPVAEGGKVVIRGYDAMTDKAWTAKASNGDEYTGAEVTSEGFSIFGLPPYSAYSAGYACFVTGNNWMQDTWDWWENSMILKGVNNGGIIGFKYFGFEGLKKDAKGVKAFEGTKKGNGTQIFVCLTPTTDKPFKLHVMMDSPWKKGPNVGSEIALLSNSGNNGQYTTLKADVSNAVDGIKGKHAIYFVVECEGATADEALFDMDCVGFAKKSQKGVLGIAHAPKVKIFVNGAEQTIPATPIRSTNQNGYTDVSHYQVTCETITDADKVTASAPADVKLDIQQPKNGTATVTATYKGKQKIYIVNKEKEPEPRRRQWGW
ncbi:MAG: hypothetical protein KBT06_05850, partial [Prevotellaceae bacterium]|nr:hypothetical protein [Candidatus Colivivens equi]